MTFAPTFDPQWTLGGMPQAQPTGMRGLLDSGLLGSIGQGLLAHGGYTTMPTTVGQGLAAGMQIHRAHQQSQLEQQIARQRLDAYVTEQRAREQERIRAQQAQAQQRASFDTLVQGLPEQDRATLTALYGADPQTAIKAAQAVVMPKPQELPAAVQIADWYQNATPAQRRAFEASRRAGAASTTINVGGGPKFQTGPGKAINDYQVALDMFGPNDPRTLALAEAAMPQSSQKVEGQLAEADMLRQRAADAIAAYEAAHQAFVAAPTPANKAAADQARSAMEIAVAQGRNIKGEPGDILIRKVGEDTPGSVRSLIQSGLGGGDPTAASLQQLKREFGVGGKPTRRPVTVDLGQELDPAEQAELDRLRRKHSR